jgi:hypothetical protein
VKLLLLLLLLLPASLLATLWGGAGLLDFIVSADYPIVLSEYVVGEMCSYVIISQFLI